MGAPGLDFQTWESKKPNGTAITGVSSLDTLSPTVIGCQLLQDRIRYPCLRCEALSVIENTCPEPERREVERHEILVRGIVQGVGFRRFVYRLATEEGLAGSISNDTDGVTIEIEGEPQRVEAFLSRLRVGT